MGSEHEAYEVKTFQNVNPAQAYLEGMLWAAYGVKVISCNAVEWQIDAVKECAKELKEKEIEHSSLSPTDKENQKRLWKQWINETTKGFKDELKRVGRIVYARGTGQWHQKSIIV